MSWVIYALIAIGLMGVSDLFRKLASGLKDPIFANFIFQIAAFFISTLMFIAARRVVNDPKGIVYAIIGGTLIALFTTFSFKALSIGRSICGYAGFKSWGRHFGCLIGNRDFKREIDTANIIWFDIFRDWHLFTVLKQITQKAAAA